MSEPSSSQKISLLKPFQNTHWKSELFFTYNLLKNDVLDVEMIKSRLSHKEHAYNRFMPALKFQNLTLLTLKLDVLGVIIPLEVLKKSLACPFEFPYD